MLLLLDRGVPLSRVPAPLRVPEPWSAPSERAEVCDVSSQALVFLYKFERRTRYAR